MRARSDVRLVAVTAFLAFILGHFVGDDSPEIDRLNGELAKVRSGLPRPRSQRVSVSGDDRPLAPPPLRSADPRTEDFDTNNATIDFSRQREAIVLSNLVARTAAESSKEYSTLFSNLGLTMEDAERFKSNLVSLHHSAIAAGRPLTQLLEERNGYDKEIRAALGEANYQTYRDYEESKPAIREYKRLQEFCATNGRQELDSAYSTEIIQLIKEAGATTTETAHGPYDPPPRPAVGKEMALQRLTQNIQEITEKSAKLIERARESGLPAQYLDLIAQYYNAKIQENATMIERVSRPVEEVIRERVRSIEEGVTGLSTRGN
jgi:hypothetical protein